MSISSCLLIKNYFFLFMSYWCDKAFIYTRDVRVQILIYKCQFSFALHKTQFCFFLYSSTVWHFLLHVFQTVLRHALTPLMHTHTQNVLRSIAMYDDSFVCVFQTSGATIFQKLKPVLLICFYLVPVFCSSYR